MTTKLNDLQLVLLSTASQRKVGNFFPVAASIAGDPDRVDHDAKLLLRRELAQETDVRRADQTWREADNRKIGLAITRKGREAIGVENATDGSLPEKFSTSTPAKSKARPKMPTKREGVIALLEADGGATLADLTGATGWLPHTARAALTGLRKSGFMISRTKTDGISRYAIAIAEAQ